MRWARWSANTHEAGRSCRVSLTPVLSHRDTRPPHVMQRIALKLTERSVAGQTAFEVSDSRLCVKVLWCDRLVMTLKDISSLPPRKRHHQLSGADFLATSRSVCSSIRQSAMVPPGQAAMHQSVAVLAGAPPNAAELSGLAL